MVLDHGLNPASLYPLQCQQSPCQSGIDDSGLAGIQCVEPMADVPSAGVDLESLSYQPCGFDNGSDIDIERSSQRYAKIVAHSTRARTQRRARAWEDWIRDANAGRSVTLLTGLTTAKQTCTCTKVSATYILDRELTKLSFTPSAGSEASAVTIPIASIEVICPATDFMLLFDQIDARLDSSEKARAVLLQYVAQENERIRVCFLDESATAKDHFVQAVTALWLEKRNDHSMWF